MNIKLLSLDIDHTLVDDENKRSPFVFVWNHDFFREKPILCYNTGRLLDDTLSLVQRKILPEPDYIISGVGTNIYDYNEKKLMKEFSEILEEGWDLGKVQSIIKELDYEIEVQPKKFQHAFKQSYFFDNAREEDIEHIDRELKNAGLDVTIVYSKNHFLDILPKWANKGNALSWLLKELDISPEASIVAGDSGNDKAMFSIPKIKGIVVGNGQQELFEATKDLEVYHSKKTGSTGVLEGLHFFKAIPNQVFEELIENAPHTPHPGEEIIEFLDELDIQPIKDEELEVIIEGYHRAVEAVKYNITPLGFAACSPTHNSSQGTDENYRSVWARDGAITIIGTIPLMQDQVIKNCQIKTFETLLKHVTPSGLIPANVSIDTDTPDYSGVGGICSIDSGLWFIIAFYEYVKKSKDLDFLRKHIDNLRLIMTWLSAQDGNNDALLEIPEAGDWTDLFGRNYNVLYDEILWYRANVCFARLMEMLGDEENAGNYLRWAQVIKQEILLNFWPSTKQHLGHSSSFAERQYSLGDARYLIAQVTPFDFSWRCDVYGNVLAYLYNVLDQEKATQAFRFMWGVGVNEPYPVCNVYPAVNPGDPDWRPYYTVNLLNLPDHYHNGGIWPFVGATWVQFVHKLGLTILAKKELYNLACLNKLGINTEWEFNEWVHGRTGRPMGKIYQAWSAAQYILTCHKLKVIK